MKRIANKVLVLLVLVAMVVSIVPVHAFATADDPIVNNEIVVEPAQSEDEHTEPAEETPQQEGPEDTVAGDSVSESTDQPETVPVQIIRDPSSPGSVTVDPNPVYAELQPALPTKKGRAAPKAAPKAKRAAPAAAPAENSPFPPPPAR